MTGLNDDSPMGLCGNDDCGLMSAWNIFSAMGFYPVNPAGGIYMIGKPLLEKTVMNLPGGHTFTIVAENLSDENIYIQSCKLNGAEWNRSYISH